MVATDSDSVSDEVVVQARGPVTDAERAYAQEKVDHLRTLVPGSVLFARVDLTAHQDPARERSSFAKAELDVNGRVVRAHVTATTMLEAVDLLASRLRERLERTVHRKEAVARRHRGDAEEVWHHADYVPPRGSSFPRPVEEREIVRTKTFAPGSVTAEEASLDLELLDHDFYLFTNADTGEDNVLVRMAESEYELVEPAPSASVLDPAAAIRPSALRPAPMSTQDAVELLNLADDLFVFFLDPESRRGRVLYRRYDGHYGLIVPADEAG
jgi:ribosome-associated translation inhibitor RaiA